MLAELLGTLGVANDPRIAVLGPRAADTAPEGTAVVRNPTTNEPLAAVRLDGADATRRTIAESCDTFLTWRSVPAPVRGQLVRAIGEEMRRLREPLGRLIALEMGKIAPEGVGEVQESVDIAEFAVGLSRQCYGLTMPSERPNHAMREQWLPLGPVGVITAFNFPNAVWAWNAMLAAVCGDVVIWKPSLFTPLISIATHAIADRVSTAMGHPGVFRLIMGLDEAVGETLIADRRVPLISATGSCRMGRRVAEVVGKRLGRTLLELGGNNAIIVDKDADLELALRAVVFGSVGTAGQRCTTTRRLIIHESIADKFVDRLVAAYKQVRIGDPLAEGTLMGPLISARAVEMYESAVAAATRQGGKVLVGGKRYTGPLHGRTPTSGSSGNSGNFVEPTVVRAPADNRLAIAQEETFAPILYVFTCGSFEQALSMQNGVDQGLSSAIFTESARTAERFLNPDGSGSDCGLAYINLGTSGAEIGGAFGGEKDTGGGRESGSDAWKAYMRRQTCTVNFGGRFDLAQGIRFE